MESEEGQLDVAFDPLWIHVYAWAMADVLKMAKTIASECVAHRARQVARVLTRAYDESIRSLGIQISQLILLVAIADAGDEGAPIGQIAKVVLMDQTTLSRNIVPLEKAGLVKRRRRGRVHSLALEPKPMQEAQAWLDRYRQFWEGNLDQFKRYLDKLQTKEAKHDDKK